MWWYQIIYFVILLSCIDKYKVTEGKNNPSYKYTRSLNYTTQEKDLEIVASKVQLPAAESQEKKNISSFMRNTAKNKTGNNLLWCVLSVALDTPPQNGVTVAWRATTTGEHVAEWDWLPQHQPAPHTGNVVKLPGACCCGALGATNINESKKPSSSLIISLKLLFSV